MKMKQISDSTIKITIQLEDLEERGWKLISLSRKKKQLNFSTPFWMSSRNARKLPWIADAELSCDNSKPDKLDVLLPNQKLTNNSDFLRICQIFLIWKSCRAWRQMNLSKPWKQSLIRQRGCRSHSPFGTRRAGTITTRSDIWSTSKSTSIFITLCVFQISSKQLPFKRSALQWIPLNYTKWVWLLFNWSWSDTEDQPNSISNLACHHSGVCRGFRSDTSCSCYTTY